MKRMLTVALAIAAMASLPMAASAQHRYDNGYPDYRHRDNSRYDDQERGLVWENSQNLNPRQGWQRVTLWVDDPASALYLEVVRGAIEFDRAEVVFENGRRMQVDLNSVRGQSRFPIVRFGGMQNVDRVVVMARPRTNGARLGVWREQGSAYGWNGRSGNDDWRWRR